MLIGIDASRAVVAQRTGTENYSYYLIRALVQTGPSHHYRLYAHQEPPQGMVALGEHVTWKIIAFPRLWTHVRLAWEVVGSPLRRAGRAAGACLGCSPSASRCA